MRELYLRPAGERADEVRRATGGKPDGPPGWDWNKSLPDRATFVTSMNGQYGGGEEKWAAAWDRMKAAEDQKRRA